jgi:Zn-dependent M28 family amino/carboxypeptidase
MVFRRPRTAAALTAGVLALTAVGVTGSAAGAAPAACSSRTNNTIDKLLACVELSGVREHQAALQAIADANGGTRASGTPGYDQSAAYVMERLEAAGWNVTQQPFSFNTFQSLSPSVLERVAPPPAAALPHAIMSYSGSGNVTAPVSVPSGDFRGCEASDFTGFTPGNIALISRGTPTGFPVACSFGLKATNAYNAGAAGVVIYNNAAGPLNGTLGNTFALPVPVVGIEQALGQQLAATAGLVLHLATQTLITTTTTSNVIAELPGKNADNVVMAGAHLDSVAAGPGINDNGSGSAALVEVAENLAKVRPQNTVRFAWWGAEEANLVGSTYYVGSLSEDQLERIALYLNFDMIGSPNYVFFIYDGDDSDATGAGAGPAGSAQIEKTFEAFFTSRGLPFKGTDFSGRSDYGPFIAAGIPSGGLFTGAEGIKTAEEAAIWGGTAGAPYDPCYHQACDTYANNNDTALAQNSDAVAYAVLSYAMSTSLINGTKSKGNFRPPANGSALAQ